MRLSSRLQSNCGRRLVRRSARCSASSAGLYFRGKLAYARRFTCPPDPTDRVVAGGILVITPNAGLRAADVAVTRESILAFAGEPIDLTNDRYRRPLELGARALGASIGPDCDVVLLGSIASGKYRRGAPADLRRAIAVSALVHRSRRHEPRRAHVALRRERRRTRLHSSGRCHSPGKAPTEARSRHPRPSSRTESRRFRS